MRTPHRTTAARLDAAVAAAKQRYALDRAAAEASRDIVHDLVRQRRRLRRRTVLRRTVRGCRPVVLAGAVIFTLATLVYGTILFFTGQPGSGECLTASGVALGLARILLPRRRGR